MTVDPRSHRLAVLGAGVMGTNIATLAVGHGVPTVLVEVDTAILARAEAAIEQNLRHGRLLGKLPDGAPGELVTSVSLEAAGDATAVVEAVTELPKTKAEVLGQVSASVACGTPVISNTSGIPIDELADWVARPDELAGAHFMNPAYLITMVEVVRGPRTSQSTMDALTALLTVLRRQAVEVRDTPGFVTSRLLHPMINHAARVVEEGAASVADVDALMQGCLGHPTGPLRTGDLIGLDNLVDSLNAMHERTGDDQFAPCELLLSKVRAGHLGRKSGCGFYDYGKVLP